MTPFKIALCLFSLLLAAEPSPGPDASDPVFAIPPKQEQPPVQTPVEKNEAPTATDAAIPTDFVPPTQEKKPLIPETYDVVSEPSKRWSVGPQFLLGFPHPLNLSVDGRLGVVGFGITGGAFSYTFKSVSPPIGRGIKNIEGRLRWFPWNGAFFLGTAIDWDSLKAEASQDFDVTVPPTTTTVPVNVSMALKQIYLTPHIGGLWVIKPGLTLGIELGIFLPLSRSSELQVSTSKDLEGFLDLVKQLDGYKKIEKDVKDKTENFEEDNNIPFIPFLTILRLGWTF